MAFTATALRGYTLPTPRGFLVFNEGKETFGIPDDMRDRLVRERVIAGDEGAKLPPVANDGLDALTKAQLRDLADANEIEIETDANKAAMLDKLRAAGVSAPGGAEAPAE